MAQERAIIFASRFRFVLVEPQYSRNVGSTARALKNLGFHRLALVAPACNPRDQDATVLAVDAVDVLLAAETFPTLDAALVGAATVVGTSRRVGKERQPHWRLDELVNELIRLSGSGDVAFVFGREADGLEAEELDRCTHLVHILADAEYPSFNLSQAVLLVAYELRRALEGPPATEAIPTIADHASREAMYEHLEEALRAVGFVQDPTGEGMMRRLRRILGRAELTPGDVRVVRGIARRILWLSRQTSGAEIEGDAEPGEESLE
jgi:TrmH family RNA methyltransferase